MHLFCIIVAVVVQTMLVDSMYTNIIGPRVPFTKKCRDLLIDFVESHQQPKLITLDMRLVNGQTWPIALDAQRNATAYYCTQEGTDRMKTFEHKLRYECSSTSQRQTVHDLIILRKSIHEMMCNLKRSDPAEPTCDEKEMIAVERIINSDTNLANHYRQFLMNYITPDVLVLGGAPVCTDLIPVGGGSSTYPIEKEDLLRLIENPLTSELVCSPCRKKRLEQGLSLIKIAIPACYAYQRFKDMLLNKYIVARNSNIVVTVMESDTKGVLEAVRKNCPSTRVKQSRKTSDENSQSDQSSKKCRKH